MRDPNQATKDTLRLAADTGCIFMTVPLETDDHVAQLAATALDMHWHVQVVWTVPTLFGGGSTKVLLRYEAP